MRKLPSVLIIFIISLSVIAGIITYAKTREEINYKLNITTSKRALQFKLWQDEKATDFSRFINNLLKNSNLTKNDVENALTQKIGTFRSDKHVIGLFVGYENNKDFFATNDFVPDEAYDCTNRPWYEIAASNEDNKVSQLIYSDIGTSQLVVGFSHKINVEGTQGVILINYALSGLIESLNGVSNDDYFLIDEDGNVLYYKTSKSEYFVGDQNLISLKDFSNGFYSKLFNSLKQNSSIKKSVSINSTFFMYETMEDCGWTVVTATKDYRIYLNLLIILIIAFYLVCVVLALEKCGMLHFSKYEQLAKKRTVINYAIYVALAIFILATTIYGYTVVVKRSAEEELFQYINEIASKNVLTFHNKIETDINNVVLLSTIIGEYSEAKDFENLNFNEIMPVLNRKVKSGDFKRIALTNLIGDTITTDGRNYNDAYSKYFELAMEGQTSISKTTIDRFDSEKINIYSTPVYNNNKIIGVLSATIDNINLSKLLEIPVLGDAAFSYVVETDGEIVVVPTMHLNLNTYENLFDRLSDKNKISILNTTIEKIRYDILFNNSGLFKYLVDKDVRYMTYMPTGINDWTLCSIIDESAIGHKSSFIVRISFFSAIISLCLFTGLLLYVAIMQYKSRKKLERIAFNDNLIGCSNFNRFEKNASDTLQKKMDKNYAVISADIDKFETINDSFGRDVGDKLLKYIAKVFENELKDGEIFCRVSQDHFYLLTAYERQSDIIEKIKRMSNEINLFNAKVNVHMSFGVCEIDEQVSVNTICDYAMLARKTIKGKHDINYAFYSDEMRKAILREKNIENIMFFALEHEEFVMFLQPKYQLNTEKIIGAEALVRWLLTDKKIIPPNEFIPVFEKNRFIIKLDYYIWEQAIKTIRKWLNNGKKPIPISINVSRVHFTSHEFVEVLSNLLEKYGVDKKYIEIELTESAFLDNAYSILEIASKLSEFGFKKSIDDFGSGYSSLNLLRKLNVEIIKIDKEFLDNNADQTRGQVVLKNIVAMIKDLNMKVVAEGVETSEHRDFLLEIGCDFAQGYYYAKPLPISKFEELAYGEIIYGV